MSEPITIKPNMVHFIISMSDGTTEATALRELADHLDSLDYDYLLHSVLYHSPNTRFNEGPVLTALLEDLTDD